MVLVRLESVESVELVEIVELVGLNSLEVPLSVASFCFFEGGIAGTDFVSLRELCLEVVKCNERLLLILYH